MVSNTVVHKAIGKRKNRGDTARGDFYEPALGVVHVPYAQFPLPRSQAHSHTSLQGWLRDAVDFCAWREDDIELVST